MEVDDAFVVAACDHGCHRDDILRVIVTDCFEVAKFSLACFFISDNIRNLHVCPRSVRLGAHEIDFSCLELSYIHCVSQPDKMTIDDVFDDFLNVAFPCATGNGVANAVVFKLVFGVILKKTLAVYVVSFDFGDDIGITKGFEIVDDHRCGDRISLGPHILSDAVSRNQFPCVVGEKAYEVLKEGHITDFIAHHDILE